MDMYIGYTCPIADYHVWKEQKENGGEETCQLKCAANVE